MEKDAIKERAFIFDLNGTMVDDMEFHTVAWHGLLNKELGRSMSLSEVKKHMYGKNEELLVRIFGDAHFSMEEMQQFSLEKEKRYQAAFLPHLKLIKGLDKFLQKAFDHQIKMAIGSAAILNNIDFVLDGLHIRHFFSSLVSADHVETSKPHPETFLKAAAQLNVAPRNCIVFEDAPKGVEAALLAGMQAVVLTTMHTKEEFAAYDNILHFINDYDDMGLLDLFEPVK